MPTVLWDPQTQIKPDKLTRGAESVLKENAEEERHVVTVNSGSTRPADCPLRFSGMTEAR